MNAYTPPAPAPAPLESSTRMVTGGDDATAIGTKTQAAVATKTQAAVVRSLLDELERCAAKGGSSVGLRAQLVEELSRLGSTILELAAALSEVTPPRLDAE